MMCSRCGLVLAAAAVFGFAPLAHADLVLSFSPDGTPSDFSVLEGQSIDIPVYLLENGGNQLENSGLFSQGVQLNFSVIPDGPTVASATPNPAFDAGPPFNIAGIDNSTGIAYFEAAVGFDTDPMQPTGIPSSILLGQFTFSGGVAGSSVLITTSSPDPSRDMFLDGTGAVLDADVFATAASATIHVTAVPEFGSAAVLLTGCVLCVWRRRPKRRQRRGTLAESAENARREPLGS